MTRTGAFNPDETIIDGLTNYVQVSNDRRDAEMGGRVYRTVAEVFRENITADDKCSLAFSSMIIRPDIRTECFVAITSSHLIIAWKQGVIRKSTESVVISLDAITEARTDPNNGSPNQRATLMKVRTPNHDVKFALPIGRADIANMVRDALLAYR